MPFEKVDPITEAVELQEMFKDDLEGKEMFRQYEVAHRETARLEQEEAELRNRLVNYRKQKNITQKELEAKTGLTQQAISRFETGSGGSIKTILKYADGIDCQLIPMERQNSVHA
ncbi:MAG: helix-turn-helix transcriptional regulator [Oscillospiraceae bacterium]|jgi:DNA-binding Xre family transcriptional regulator|nr:helix-turn-helix transcriptional regulator [Oscillospiraceae bacterium]